MGLEKAPELVQLGSHTHPRTDHCGKENVVLLLASLGHMSKGAGVGGRISPIQTTWVESERQKVDLPKDSWGIPASGTSCGGQKPPNVLNRYRFI